MYSVFFKFSAYNEILIISQTKVGDMLDSGLPHHHLRNVLVYAITLKGISIFFFKLDTHVKGGQRKISILR